MLATILFAKKLNDFYECSINIWNYYCPQVVLTIQITTWKIISLPVMFSNIYSQRDHLNLIFSDHKDLFVFESNLQFLQLISFMLLHFLQPTVSMQMQNNIVRISVSFLCTFFCFCCVFFLCFNKYWNWNTLKHSKYNCIIEDVHSSIALAMTFG